MPHASAKDGTRLYYEEAGSGSFLRGELGRGGQEVRARPHPGTVPEQGPARLGRVREPAPGAFAEGPGAYHARRLAGFSASRIDLAHRRLGLHGPERRGAPPRARRGYKRVENPTSIYLCRIRYAAERKDGPQPLRLLADPAAQAQPLGLGLDAELIAFLPVEVFIRSSACDSLARCVPKFSRTKPGAPNCAPGESATPCFRKCWYGSATPRPEASIHAR